MSIINVHVHKLVQINHLIRYTILVVSDTFGNNFINIGNIDKYFTESSSEGRNNQFFLNLFIQSWAGFIHSEASPRLDEQIQEKLT